MTYLYSRTRRLDTLPVEIICLVFSNLDMQSLLSCSMATKHLRKVISGSIHLQYAIELGRHRMVSLLPASSTVSLNMRLNTLRSRERAWKYLDWKKQGTLDLPPTGSVYEFIGGLYGNGREDDSRVTASISFLELPTTDFPHRKSQTWTHMMGETTIVDFTMDPSQDLLVLVALARQDSKFVYELHLRSIKTNRPHPRASAPVLPCLLKPDAHTQASDIVAAVRVQAAGAIVALLIKEVSEGPNAHLEIWKWDGNPQYSCVLAEPDGIDDFTFLTHETFLLVLPTGQFVVYDFEWPIAYSTLPHLRAIYNFPPLTPGYQYWYISMSSNPAPGYVPRYSTDPEDEGYPGHKQMYYPSPDERIHACCIYVYNPSSQINHQVHSFVFFLNLRTLLKSPEEWRMKSTSPPSWNTDPQPTTAEIEGVHSCALLNYPLFPSFGLYTTPLVPTETGRRINRTTPKLHSKEIHWREWGPQTTRWFEESISTDWQHAVYGLRTVETVDPAKVQRPSQLAAVNRFIQESMEGYAAGVHTDTSRKDNEDATSPSGELFASDSDDGPDPALDPGTDPTPMSGTDEGVEDQHDDTDADLDNGRRCLRIRDFNPYSFADADTMKLVNVFADDQNDGNTQGRKGHRWRFRRLVTSPSTTPVKGVFEHDIVSSLPYVEVVSEELFDVTDVMMDDSRILLLKRGDTSRLERLGVLMM